MFFKNQTFNQQDLALCIVSRFRIFLEFLKQRVLFIFKWCSILGKGRFFKRLAKDLSHLLVCFLEIIMMLLLHSHPTYICDTFHFFLSFFLSFCLSVFLSVLLSFCLSFRPSVLLSFFLSFFLSFCLSVSLSFCLSFFLFVFLSYCLSFRLSVFPSFCLAVFLSFSVCLL